MRLVYERGTIVLRDAPPDLEIAQLPGVKWDQRVGAYRAPARHREEIRRALSALGVRFSDIGPADGRSLAPWRPPPLRTYQREALEAWERAGRRGLVVLPTGAGKTRVALAAAARSGTSALCLVPTRVLLGQWHDALAAVFEGAVGILGDGEHRLLPITVATFESAWRQMDLLGDRFELLIVDEVHHLGGALRAETLEMCAARFRLGLTAFLPGDTPARARLAGSIGSTVFERSIEDLRGAWLADFERIPLLLQLTADEREEYEESFGRFLAFTRGQGRLPPDGGWRDLVRVARQSREGLAALEGWRRAREILSFPRAKQQALRDLLVRHREDRVLVFTSDNASAYRIAREHLVMPITCEVGRKEREEALTAFRQGSLKVLVSAQVLNEGIDVPDARVGIVVAGRFGAREHVQRVGRLLRPAAGKEAVIYEMVVRRSWEVRQAERRAQGLAPRASSTA